MTSLRLVLLVAVLVSAPHANAQEIKFALPTPAGAPSTSTPSALVALPSGIATPQKSTLERESYKDFDNLHVLMVHPPTQLEWVLDGTQHAVVIGFGFDPAVYDKDTNGADFVLELVGRKQKSVFFREHLDPVKQVKDRGERHRRVVLPPYEAGSRLIFRTEGGEFNNTAWDWVYLSQFQFARDDSDQVARYPGFNRFPIQISGENFAIFHDKSDRPFLYAGTPSVLEFKLNPSDTQMEFDYEFSPNSYSDGGHTNGAIFRVERKRADGKIEKLFENYPKPVEHNADRGLLKARVTLTKSRAGDRLILSILPGDNNDASWDHTFLRRVEFK